MSVRSVVVGWCVSGAGAGRGWGMGLWGGGVGYARRMRG